MPAFLLNGETENYDLERGFSRHSIADPYALDGGCGLNLSANYVPVRSAPSVSSSSRAASTSRSPAAAGAAGLLYSQHVGPSSSIHQFMAPVPRVEARSASPCQSSTSGNGQLGTSQVKRERGLTFFHEWHV
jgi:hypothetical protein